jgi:hypothetical protein
MEGTELEATLCSSSQVASTSVVAEFNRAGFIVTFPSMGVDMIGWEG